MVILAEATRACKRHQLRRALHARISDHCRRILLWLPLLPVAVGLVAGIIFDRLLPAPWAAYTGSFLLAGLVLILAFRKHTWAAPLAIIALFLASASVGALRHQVAFWRVSSAHILNFFPSSPPQLATSSPLLSTQHSALSTAVVAQPPSAVGAVTVPQDSALRTQDSAPITLPLGRLRGTIVTDPLVRMPDPVDYGLTTSDKPHTSFALAAEQILTPAGWMDCDGLVQVIVRGRADHVRMADSVELYASLAPIDGPRNPGEYDWRLYNRRCGLYVTASVAQPQSVLKRPESGSTGTLSRLIGQFRQCCRRALLDGIETGEPQAGLLATYVAGQRSSVSRQINDAFRRSGTAHLLAVSGSHVALIAMFGGLLGWLVLRRRRPAALVAFAAVVFFSLLVDPNAPALRSAIMAILAVSGMLLNRPFNSGNWLAGSAILLLLIAPADLFRPPFQMTFVAVIALIWLTPAVCDLLFGPRDLAGWLRLRIRLSRPPTRWSKASLTVKNALSYSTAAWLANAPVLAWHFGQFNPYGSIATLLIGPLAAFTLILGFCKMLLGLLAPSLGELLAWPLARLADCMAWSAGWLGSWPAASLHVAAPPLWLLLVAYVALALWAAVSLRRWWEASPIPDRWRSPSRQHALLEPVTADHGESIPVRCGSDRLAASHATSPPRQQGIILAGGESPESGSARPPIPVHGPLVPVDEMPRRPIYRPVRPLYVLAAASVLIGIYAFASCPTMPKHPRAHVLSVGDGLCVLIRSPTGQNLLYDCGSLTFNGCGRKIVVPALQALGIRRIDVAVLSHANLDHYDGLIDVAKAIPLGQVLLGEAFQHEAAQGLARKLLEDLADLHVPVATVVQGDTVGGLGPVSVDVVWPPAQFVARDANDTSVVLRVSCSGRRILLTGDIARFGQGRLARERPQDVLADVLLVPHHGSQVTLDPRFIPAASPRLAIASTKDSRRSAMLAQSSPSGCVVLDTWSCGMLTVDLLPTGPSVTPFCPEPPPQIR